MIRFTADALVIPLDVSWSGMERLMKKNLPEKSFDDAARRLIRRKLLSYLQQEKIGVPKLAGIIEKANPQRTIQLATLQRFLADKARTQDEFVAILAEFVARLPDQEI